MISTERYDRHTSGWSRGFPKDGRMPAKVSFGFGFCLAAIAAAPALANEWRVNDTISALDGSRTYAATLQSSNTIHDPTGSDEQATLVIRCAGGLLDVYIVWPQTLGAGPLEMRWKADADKPTSEVWSVSIDRSVTFSEDPRTFLGKLRGAQDAGFQLSLANFDSLQASFHVEGTGKIADTALAACPN
jgi:hypothetical protein